MKKGWSNSLGHNSGCCGEILRLGMLGNTANRDMCCCYDKHGTRSVEGKRSLLGSQFEDLIHHGGEVLGAGA